MIFNWILIYMTLGIMCGFCFEILFDKLDMKQPTNFERFFWIIAWPYFLTVFIISIIDDYDD